MTMMVHGKMISMPAMMIGDPNHPTKINLSRDRSPQSTRLQRVLISLQKNKITKILFIKKVVAGAVGIEPTQEVLETPVLPLYDAPEKE